MLREYEPDFSILFWDNDLAIIALFHLDTEGDWNFGVFIYFFFF